MAVFSEIKADSIILGKLGDRYKKILLVGCGGCTNESLAYTNHLPIFDEFEGQRISAATKYETDRIKELLENNGYKVEITLIPLSQNALCIRHDGEKFQMNPNSKFEPDVILAMRCLAGAFGIHSDIEGKIQVMPIMEQKGQLAYYYEEKDKKTIIVYEKSAVLK
jgi:hypothetical protein